MRISPTRPPSVPRAFIEPLEQRIAPAALTGFKATASGSPLLLEAGTDHAGLSTSDAGGAYLVYVTQGKALVFTTDFNHNNQVDFNEITGIAAGNGLRLISFVDIHGDIVTNLNPDGTLTDSDHNAANGRDGRVLLNSQIQQIDLRSVTGADLAGGDNDILDRLALSSYSIFGNIYAGKGFGGAGGGLHVDTSGQGAQTTKFSGSTGLTQAVETTPSIGSIRVGTAASNASFNFGVTQSGPINGQLVKFIPPAGQNGADIIGIGAVDSTTQFNIGTLHAGDGGAGARGGNVTDVHLAGDTAGGYSLIAGNGGDGVIGGAGGGISRFSDTGSITGQVFLQSGTGGAGLLGKGGAGGTVLFDPAEQQNIAGRIEIRLGDGGDGFSAGGNGGSLGSANITTPETVVPFALTFVSTMRQAGDIGTTRPIDFDGDRFGDAVFTTADPDQLIVVFGDGNGGFDIGKTIYLNGPENAKALVVGDFNGDGRPDIATASANPSLGGVSVFLNRGTDPSGRFGFSDALQSALPSLNVTPFPGFFEKPVPVLNLAAGDFNNDGVMDLGVMTIETFPPPAGHPDQNVVIVLNGVKTPGTANGSGFFRADFATSSSRPFAIIGNDASSDTLLKATALSAGGGDVLLAAQQGQKQLTVFKLNTSPFQTTLDFQQSIALGKVDTNREAGKTTLVDATVVDFAVADINNDGNADIAVLANDGDFLLTLQGTGNSFFSATGSADDAGILLTSDKGLGLTTPVGVLATNADGSGGPNDIAIIDFGNATHASNVTELVFSGLANPTVFDQHFFAQPFTISDSVLAFDTYTPDLNNPNSVGYGVAIPSEDNPFFDFIELTGDGGFFDFFSLTHNGLFVTAGNGGDSLIGPGGAGGSIGGGSLNPSTGIDPATGITSITATGKVTVILPQQIAYEATVRLVGGNGGNGLTNGGAGGNLSGIVLDYAEGTAVLTGNALLLAGNGGTGFTGTGGHGGNLRGFHVSTAEVFSAGNGGLGVIGGAGGSIFGNRVPGLLDTGFSAPGVTAETTNADVLALAVLGGLGADGIRQGGSGGSVDHFIAEFLPVVGAAGGQLLYYAGGAGGSAIGGVGGNGGSVISSSPVAAPNLLVGDIFVQGGAGGSGLAGGRGGSITNFLNSPTSSSVPDSASILGGNGGFGIFGAGGAGGIVANVNVTSKGPGTQSFFDFSDPASIRTVSDAIISIIPLDYGRIIAGQGGDSYGGSGGLGGDITNVTATTISAAIATVAGRGGDGLLAGGAGGAVTNSSINSRAGTADAAGKVLVVAGDGGDSFSARAQDPNDAVQAAFTIGGVDGPGGTGGSIVGFRQTPSTDTNVDLIAGNGGNTVNHGASSDATTNVGRGGSISRVSIEGNIGNIDPSVAIKSYNDVHAGERMADFVASTLINQPFIQLDDSLGNVGLVAGSAGRVRDNNNDGVLDSAPASAANGSVATLHARNIMSMVAGSVDRIAAILSISNVSVTSGGILGANKTVDSNGNTFPGSGLDYYDPGTNACGPHDDTVQLGGCLIDGAIVAKNLGGLTGPRVFTK